MSKPPVFYEPLALKAGSDGIVACHFGGSIYACARKILLCTWSSVDAGLLMRGLRAEQ